MHHMYAFILAFFFTCLRSPYLIASGLPGAEALFGALPVAISAPFLLLLAAVRSAYYLGEFVSLGFQPQVRSTHVRTQHVATFMRSAHLLCTISYQEVDDTLLSGRFQAKPDNAI